jgi:hypothetical protein
MGRRNGRGGRGPRGGSFRGDGVGGPKGGGGQGEAGDRRRGHRTTPGLSLGALWGCHTLEALKLRGAGEWLSIHPRRGGLGLAIHWWLSMHCGAESDMALAGGVAGWEWPWLCGLPKLVWLERGVAHTQTVAGWELPCTGRSQSCVVRGRWSRNLFRHQTRGFSCSWELLRGCSCFC